MAAVWRGYIYCVGFKSLSPFAGSYGRAVRDRSVSLLVSLRGVCEYLHRPWGGPCGRPIEGGFREGIQLQWSPVTEST